MSMAPPTGGQLEACSYLLSVNPLSPTSLVFPAGQIVVVKFGDHDPEDWHQVLLVGNHTPPPHMKYVPTDPEPCLRLKHVSL